VNYLTRFVNLCSNRSIIPYTEVNLDFTEVDVPFPRITYNMTCYQKNERKDKKTAFRHVIERKLFIFSGSTTKVPEQGKAMTRFKLHSVIGKQQKSVSLTDMPDQEYVAVLLLPCKRTTLLYLLIN
jgi:hypothetical protein